MNENIVQVDNISKIYGTQIVFDKLSFNVRQEETFAIIGHSGCGKTTLLRMIGGFESADNGEVRIRGQIVNKPIKSAIMIFQDFAQLLPWRTLIDNVIWPMMVTNTMQNRTDAKQIAVNYLTEMGINSSDYVKYPAQCSGGMKQRVALARALSLKPKILLMDEPFGSLDNLTRKKMQIMTKEIANKYGLTVILVTHSISEAIKMSDRILIFNDNKQINILQNDKSTEQNIKLLLGI